MNEETKESSKKTASKETKKAPAKKKPTNKAKPAAKKATPAAKKTTVTKAKTTKRSAKPTAKADTKSATKPKTTRATVKPKAKTTPAPKKSAPKPKSPPKAKATASKSAAAGPIKKENESAPKGKAKASTSKATPKVNVAPKTAAKTKAKPTVEAEAKKAPKKTVPKSRKPAAAKKSSPVSAPVIAPEPEATTTTAQKTAQPTAPTRDDAKEPAKSTSKSTNRPNKKPTSPRTNKPGKPKNQQTNQQASQQTSTTRSVKLLINADEPEECRVALLENGKLESFHIETEAKEQNKGNIYKCKVMSVEKNLQAAFVDFGTGKNGFLPFSEIHPEYYSANTSQDSHWKDLNIKEAVKEGQEMLVEVVKETTGNKGASLTTYLSLPGRYVVLMPGSDSHGISRQIDNREQRSTLREMLADCNIPEGVGYIIRTAAKGITKTALSKDVKFQINLWKEIKKRGQSQPTPSLVFKEQDIIDRFLRDHFSPEIQEILTDNQEAFNQVNNFLDLLPAAQRKKTSAKLHKGPRPLLNSYNIEDQIEQIYRPTVKLPSGGSIVINPTEALVAIDVNSGSTGRDKNFEETIFMANMEAAEELTRQLRLRDLGGLVVVDFIDMRSMAHTKEVERKVKAGMKRDKAKVDFSRISKFGLMQISRQRMGAPVHAGNYVTCTCCQGRGAVRSVENQALTHLRQIQTGVTRKHVKTVHCTLPIEVSQYLLNKKRADLAEMERRYRVNIVIEGDAGLNPAQAKIDFLKR